jgi:hypothetical protein
VGNALDVTQVKTALAEEFVVASDLGTDQPSPAVVRMCGNNAHLASSQFDRLVLQLPRDQAYRRDNFLVGPILDVEPVFWTGMRVIQDQVPCHLGDTLSVNAPVKGSNTVDVVLIRNRAQDQTFS